MKSINEINKAIQLDKIGEIVYRKTGKYFLTNNTDNLYSVWEGSQSNKILKQNYYLYIGNKNNNFYFLRFNENINNLNELSNKNNYILILSKEKNYEINNALSICTNKGKVISELYGTIKDKTLTYCLFYSCNCDEFLNSLK